MKAKHLFTDSKKGFTVVEVLIVIVVIAILATITVISYSAITQRGNLQAVETDLRTTATELNKYRANNGAYPASAAFSSVKTTNTSGQTTYSYTSTPAAGTYCLQATGFGASFHMTNGSSEATEGNCP